SLCTNLLTTSETIVFRIVAPTTVDDGATLLFKPSISHAASPICPWLSITTSTISYKFLPELCLDETLFEYSRFVTPIVLTPFFLASSAISIVDGLRPDTE